MTSIEIQRAINEFISLYPNYYRNLSADSMHNIMKSWERRFEKVDDYKTFIDTLYEYDSKSDYPNPPTTKQILDLYNTLKKRKEHKNGGRRIVTDDEWRYELYLNEMKKPPEKRNEWLIKRCLESCEIMTNPEAYKRKHGAYREEFERY